MSHLALLPSTKCCNICKQFLPLNMFSANNAIKKDKLSLYCRDCDKEKQEANQIKSNASIQELELLLSFMKQGE